MFPARRGSDKSGLWWEFIIGLAIIGVIFVVLEVSRKSADEPPSAAWETAPELPAVVEPTAALGPDIRGSDEISDAKPVVMTPVPDEKPVPQDAAIQPASEDELLAREPVLILTDLESRRDHVILRDRQLFERAIGSKAWNAYRGLLEKSIDAGMRKLPEADGLNRFDAIWKEPVLYQAFLRWHVLGLLSDDGIPADVTVGYSGGILPWLCYNTEAMEEFLLTIKPQDDKGGVLTYLFDASRNTPDKMEKYFPLALACAVVFDQPVVISDPVAGSAHDEPTAIDPLQRYMWFVEKNEKGLLAAPVHHSTARDLVWVVGAPVSTSELDWSLDQMHLSRKQWGNAYGMIEYLMERAVEGLNPYEEYTFAEILKEGGICGDQSYFCANTARAQGIPAMIFSGETDLGSHAWVGLKVQADEWSTSIGRIDGASKGQTRHPQTGAMITEQEVQLWGDRAHQSPVTTRSVMRHLWLASYFGNTGKDGQHADAVRLANQLGPSFTETWAALYALLEEQTKPTGDPPRPDNLEGWKSFASAMRREFKDDPRMAALAVDAENEYVFPYADEGDAARELARERRRIERNSGEQKDLIAESLKREADLIAKRDDATTKKEISSLYDSALRQYGGSITGFKMMANDYFEFMKDDPELARKSARDIELAFKRVVESGTKEWFRAQTESAIYRMICGYYRVAGDEDRAQMLEKRYETLLRRAERGAL